ncbi:tRNA (adenine(22)-N(1))-methyltransferase [Rubeoparvulum massiliense]|uniref:tRNA (adenine(22)-N(1))-methyltransferase n=1 Tax=Rubeoparvulum massiliense TaxID=1631346 RepID=UPI00065E695B|nr:class I SAM-dependent methyltransferase [Rubeoparvulum massiliense]
MSVENSIRLQTIAQLVPSGYRIADIGSDHAYLPTYLVREGIAPVAIAGELNEGPLQMAHRHVDEAGLSQEIAIRQGDGLSVLTPGEVDAIVIAGMGGTLITSILQNDEARLAGVQCLILQPNVAAQSVRRWLYSHGWQLVAERIVKEDGKIYEMMAAEPAQRKENQEPWDPAYDHPQLSQEHLFLVGPLLVRQGGAIFHEKWQGELHKREQALESMMKAKEQEQVMEQLRRFQDEITIIKEVLQCTYGEKQSSNGSRN